MTRSNRMKFTLLGTSNFFKLAHKTFSTWMPLEAEDTLVALNLMLTGHTGK